MHPKAKIYVFGRFVFVPLTNTNYLLNTSQRPKPRQIVKQCLEKKDK